MYVVAAVTRMFVCNGSDVCNDAWLFLGRPLKSTDKNSTGCTNTTINRFAYSMNTLISLYRYHHETCIALPNPRSPRHWPEAHQELYSVYQATDCRRCRISFWDTGSSVNKNTLGGILSDDYNSPSVRTFLHKGFLHCHSLWMSLCRVYSLIARDCPLVQATPAMMR